jgi:hypothetical protein
MSQWNYQVVWSFTLDGLRNKIIDSMAYGGWKCQGGIYRGMFVWAQAMVRDEEW